MSLQDKRKNYIKAIAQNILGPEASSLAERIPSLPEVAAFLDDPSVTLLQIVLNGSDLTASVAWSSPPGGAREVHFMKTVPQVVTEAGMSDQIAVSSSHQNPVAALLSSLSEVYLPSAKSPGDLATQLKELTAAISRSMSREHVSKVKSIADLNNFKDIQSLAEEASFWKDLGTGSTGLHDPQLLQAKDGAKRISELLTQMSRSFAEAEELPRMIEALEKAGDNIDQLWKDFAIYSEERTKHLFRLVTAVLQTWVQTEFASLDPWTGSFAEVKEKLNESIRLTVVWGNQIADLTQRYWTGGRRWSSGKWSESGLAQLRKRLNEIFVVRSQHDELSRLLSTEEQKRLNVEGAFKAFRNIDVLNCMSKYSLEEWQEAQREYARSVQPIEGEIIAKLRKEIFSEKLNATQLLREFRRWRGLLDLANIRAAFANERESLLDSLVAEAVQLKEEFETRTGQRVDAVAGMDRPPESRYSSKHVSAILWTRQLFTKLQSNFKMAQNLLGDLRKFEDYVRLAQDMTNLMKGYETDQYKDWAEDIKYQMETENGLALNMGGKFMDISTKNEGMVEVNYSERLAILIREVRQLKELDFKIPKDIDKLAEDAKKFYKQAVTLKQIADFYNNMGSQIIHSQRPMMIKLALEFERTMNSSELKEGTTWQNTLELERYIARVKAAAEGLMNENRRLRRIHEVVGEMVGGLFGTDLVKNRQKWKDGVERIRSTVEAVCKGRDTAEVTGWLLHWDHQLYKVLQYHYVTGLHALSDILPSFNVDIVYNEKQIAFKPPLEELKSKYYKEIKSFIAIPAHFTGVGGSATVFKSIIDTNASGLQVVYAKAEVVLRATARSCLRSWRSCWAAWKGGL